MILTPLELVIPDGDEARRRAEEELARQEYQAAKPTWFDEFAADVVEWIARLFSPDGAGGAAPFAVTIIVIVVVAALIVALIVWGRPRATRTVRRRVELLGERDDRSAAQLRTDAERRAREQDWNAAVVLRFRAIARSLWEREIIDPAPGATAQGIAREGSTPLPGLAARLHAAATTFDAVRYLGRTVSEGDYRTLAETDALVRTTMPIAPAAETVRA